MSRAAATKRSTREKQAIQLAAERLAILHAAKACAAVSKRDAYPIIVELISAGHLDSWMWSDKIPSLATFLRWLPEGDDWKQVHRTVGDFLPG